MVGLLNWWLTVRLMILAGSWLPGLGGVVVTVVIGFAVSSFIGSGRLAGFG